MKKIIKLTESDLHSIIKNTVKRILKENKSQDAIDFHDFVDITNNNGWGYSYYREARLKDGRNAILYHMERDNKNATPIEKVVEELKNKSNDPDGIILGKVQYIYAPEITKPVIYITY